VKERIAVLLLLGILPWAEVHAQAQTAQTTFVVKARVQAVCEVTATDLDFGTFTAEAGSPLVGSTLLRATCTPGSTYNVGLDAGTSAGATVNARKMVSGANNLNYQLYSDSSRSTIWGNTAVRTRDRHGHRLCGSHGIRRFRRSGCPGRRLRRYDHSTHHY
jgi:spore coat protein U-like protein